MLAITETDWVGYLTPLAVLIVLVYQKIQAKVVKGALDQAAIKSNDKLTEINALVNGSKVEAKRTMMLANLTKDPADTALAVDAQRAYAETFARQQRVDAMLGKAGETEHRLLISDGPVVHLINERLASIEGMLKSLPCVALVPGKGLPECPPPPPPPPPKGQ